MAARGQVAKEYVEKKLVEAFGGNYLGVSDKKIYVQAPENGEMVQVAITLTCPKVPVAFEGIKVSNPKSNEWNFDEDVAPPSPVIAKRETAITEEEQNNIRALMKELGL